MSPFYQHRRAKLDKIIEQRFTVSLMSNAKWVDLLHVLTGYDSQPKNPQERLHSWDLVSSCRAKLVLDDESVRTLFLDYKVYNFDYYDQAMEAMIFGQPSGWYDYKEIEWIEFLRDGTCDVERIAAAIRQRGQFALELTASALRMYAYQK
jgi:hypothetical protein